MSDTTNQGPPTIPPTGEFIVRRFNPALGDGEIEEIRIHAHTVDFLAKDAVKFSEYYVHPVLGPTQRIVRYFACIEDFEEVPVRLSLVVNELGTLYPLQ